MSVIHPFLRHPRTSAPLVALGLTRAGRPIWPVLGASQPVGEPAAAGGATAAVPPTTTGTAAPPAIWNIYTGSSGPGQQGQQGQQAPAPAPAPAPAVPQGGGNGSGQNDQGQSGQPANPGVPWRELPLEDQVDYWRTRSRRHESRQLEALGLKPGELEQLRTAAERAQTHMTEAEQRGRAAALREVGGRLVEAHMRVSIGQRMTDEQVSGLLSNLDLSRFQTEAGEVDTAKVAQFVSTVLPATAAATAATTTAPGQVDPATVAPAATAGATGEPGTGESTRQVPDMGQGDRQIARPSGLAAGREIAAARYGNRARSAAAAQQQ